VLRGGDKKRVGRSWPFHPTQQHGNVDPDPVKVNPQRALVGIPESKQRDKPGEYRHLFT